MREKGATPFSYTFSGAEKLPIRAYELASPAVFALEKNARVIAQEKGYRFVWIRKGGFRIHKNELSPVISIVTESNLKQIV
ncbi:hypothetical protein TKK_0002902 [Trichogramma kaykai]